VQGIVDEIGRLYKAENKTNGTHLALRWNGRVRFTIPNEKAAQETCWSVFCPGRLALPMRAMARLPRLLGTVSCVEAEHLVTVRQLLGKEAGLSCCRTGAKGVWSKDTILFLDSKSKPLFIVKVGTGKDVDALLENEANWLQRLRNKTELANHIPEFVAHHCGSSVSFVAQRAKIGNLDFRLGTVQIDFLRKLQNYSLRLTQYQDSFLYRTLNLRAKNLRGLLSEAWSIRLEKAMRQINESLSSSLVQLVVAHNDFTPWNIRVEHNLASVFDWEYAADEQFPLFDPLHFVMMPMALNRDPRARMIQRMNLTVRLCRQWLGEERCHQAETQALAYFVNLCILYLWGARERPGPNSVVDAYAQVIDYLLSADKSRS
jgi:hypothetical protein